MLLKEPATILASLAKKEFTKEIIIEALLFKGHKQEKLFELARKKRAQHFSPCKVEIRSVIELSNICQQNCNFCNINARSKIKRYVLGHEEFINIVDTIYSKGRKVILLQSGENSSRQYVDFVSTCVRTIKQKYRDMTVMLCLGNLDNTQYAQLKEAGADRYVLKFETSNPALYAQIKPSDSLEKRIHCLDRLIGLGFETGSGNMIGLPGQTIEDIAQDLFFLSNFDLTMASCTVFIPGQGCAYEHMPCGNLDITLNFIALMRIMFPKILIPATSSLEKVSQGGQYRGLMAGANTVTVHDGTPEKLKTLFPIYSGDRFTPTEKYVHEIVLKAQY
ncbi:MAG: radical SAM protein [Candidatus Omnitrophota bacterium]